MNTDKPVILFVDDEEMILKSIRRELRKEPWDCLYALSGSKSTDYKDLLFTVCHDLANYLSCIQCASSFVDARPDMEASKLSTLNSTILQSANMASTLLRRIRDLEKIQRYHRVSSREGTSGETGTGFGLPLFFRWVEKLNGTASVKSVSKSVDPQNCGTTWTISFPSRSNEL